MTLKKMYSPRPRATTINWIMSRHLHSPQSGEDNPAKYLNHNPENYLTHCIIENYFTCHCCRPSRVIEEEVTQTNDLDQEETGGDSIISEEAGESVVVDDDQIVTIVDQLMNTLQPSSGSYSSSNHDDLHTPG